MIAGCVGEWITGSVCMYLARYLATKYQSNTEVNYLLNNMEFVMVPIVNPDGIAVSPCQLFLWFLSVILLVVNN